MFFNFRDNSDDIDRVSSLGQVTNRKVLKLKKKDGAQRLREKKQAVGRSVKKVLKNHNFFKEDRALKLMKLSICDFRTK